MKIIKPVLGTCVLSLCAFAFVAQGQTADTDTPNNGAAATRVEGAKDVPDNGAGDGSTSATSNGTNRNGPTDDGAARGAASGNSAATSGAAPVQPSDSASSPSGTPDGSANSSSGDKGAAAGGTSNPDSTKPMNDKQSQTRYEADVKKCDEMSGDAKETCKQQAKANRDGPTVDHNTTHKSPPEP